MSDAEVSAFVAGRLAPLALASVEHHLDGCATCREWIALVVPAGPSGAPSGEPRPGDLVGRYRLQAHLGQGGMGTVFLAADPELERQVAIKLVRLPTGAGPTLERDELRLLREARAMARVIHPNVVQVFDAGRHAGAVYVAMEYVQGDTLAGWRMTQAPSWLEIVDRFVEIGQGLAAAHDAGLVHRDFKPANVLVSGEGRAKVTDFGLARVVENDHEVPGRPGGGDESTRGATDGHVSSVVGSVIGTLAYMAPEQRRGEVADARSDQFAYAMALAEALLGSHPIARGGGEPSADPATSVAAALAGKRLPARLRRAIVRGVSGPPARRYPRMDDFVHDLARVRDARRARPRRIAMALALGAALAAVVGTTRMSSPGASPDPCARASATFEAVWNSAVPAQLASAAADSAMAHATDHARRLTEVVERYAHDWREARRATCRATHVEHVQSEPLLDLQTRCLDAGRDELAALLGAVTEPGGFALLGRALEAALALPSPSECRRLTKPGSVRGASDAEARVASAALTRDLSRARSQLKLGKISAARQTLAALVPRVRAAAELALLAETLLEEANAAEAAGELDLAETGYAEAARAAARADQDEVRAAAWIGVAYLVGHLRARLPEAQQALAAADEAILGAGDVPALRARHALLRGTLLVDAGRYADACAQNAVALTAAEAAYGRDSVELARFLVNQGACLRLLGDLPGAATALERAVALRERHLGPHHLALATPLMNLAQVRAAQGQLDLALALCRRALELRQAALGNAHAEVATVYATLGALLRQTGDLGAAREAHRAALSIQRAALGEDHPNVGLSLLNLGAVAIDAGDLGEAAALLDHALRVLVAARGPSHPQVATVYVNLGELAWQRGDCRAAEGAFRHALDIRMAALGADHVDLAFPLTGLGRCLVKRRRPREAEPLLRRALALRDGERAAPELLVEPAFALAQALWLAPSTRAEARSLATRALAAIPATTPPDPRAAQITAWLERRQ